MQTTIELSASRTSQARACPPSIGADGILHKLRERVHLCREVAQATADPVLRAAWRGEAEGIEFCIDLIQETEE